MDILQQPDGGITEGSNGLRSVSGTDGGDIFAQDGVPDPMETVLDSPMTPGKVKHLLRRGHGDGERGDDICHFGRVFSGAVAQARASDAAPLPEPGPCDIACGHTLDAPGLGSAARPASVLMAFHILRVQGKKRVPPPFSSVCYSP